MMGVAELYEKDIWKMKGPVRLIPNNGYRCTTFKFANVSDDEICDLLIISEDLDFWSPSPEIVSDDEAPPHGPGVEVKKITYPAGEAKKVGPRINPTRTNQRREATETHVAPLSECIKPGEIFQVKVCLDAPLTSNRQLSFSPSHKDGSGFSGETEEPKALTLGEFLKVILGIGLGIGGDVAAGAAGKAVSKPFKEALEKAIKEATKEIVEELKEK